MSAALAHRRVDLVRADAVVLGRAVRRALWTDEALALLPVGCGWNDGGCLLLADALCVLLGGDARLIAVVSGVDRVAQHYVVRLPPRHGPGWYLDADGAALYATLLRRWSEVERVRLPRLVPAANAVRHLDVPRDPQVSERIARWLRKQVKSV